jgi:hypothetical protein
MQTFAQLYDVRRPPATHDLLVDETLRLLEPETAGQSATLAIPRPRNDAELLALLEQYLGVRLPAVVVTPGHATPAQAFCDAYFARSPVAIWYGARALAGKTFTLAALGWMEAVTLRASVSILGGSGEQSQRTHEYMHEFWRRPNAPVEVLVGDPGTIQTRLVWGNRIKALAASQRQARGGHPERLRLDEADELDWRVYESVMGQPMSRGDVPSQTVICSTLQNIDGTMSKLLRLAAERGWPIYQWGYQETLEPHGWLSPVSLARQKAQMTDESWRVEVEMGEPSTTGRAIMREKVEAMFVGPELEVEENEEREFEPPEAGAEYATGADWGQSEDYTEIVTLRTDTRPMRLVAYRFMRRRPYPEMVAKLDERLARYPGDAAHDYTGVGHVGEFLTNPVEDVTMVGRVRQDLFTSYILAVERGELRAPRVRRLYRQHIFCRTQDLYGHGEGAHPPDGLVAFAMANKAASVQPVRLLFAQDGPAALKQATTAGLGRAATFLRRGNGGNGGNGAHDAKGR